MLKVGGGGTQSFEVVFTQEIEVLAILKGVEKCPPFKREGAKCFTLFSYFVNPPSP